MSLEDGFSRDDDVTDGQPVSVLPEDLANVPGAVERYQHLIGLDNLELGRMTRDENQDELTTLLAAHILSKRREATGWRPGDFERLDEWEKSDE